MYSSEYSNRLLKLRKPLERIIFTCRIVHCGITTRNRLLDCYYREVRWLDIAILADHLLLSDNSRVLADVAFELYHTYNCLYSTISYYSESGIWPGKILVNGISFTKSAKVFPAKNFRYTVIFAAPRFRY